MTTHHGHVPTCCKFKRARMGPCVYWHIASNHIYGVRVHCAAKDTIEPKCPSLIIVVVRSWFSPLDESNGTAVPRLHPSCRKYGHGTSVRAYKAGPPRLDGRIDEDRIPGCGLQQLGIIEARAVNVPNPIRLLRMCVIGRAPAERCDLGPPEPVLLVAGDNNVANHDSFAQPKLGFDFLNATSDDMERCKAFIGGIVAAPALEIVASRVHGYELW
jgi:hypothetical protein